jgi:polyhydroxybutyrate depolymerase
MQGTKAMDGWRTRAMAALAMVIVVAASACGGSATSVGTPAGSAPGSAGTSPAATDGTTEAPSGTSAPGSPARSAPKPSAGCGTSKVRAVDAETHTLPINGTERFYLLTTPAAHDGAKPLPLVLDFHGLSEGAQVHTKMSNFGELAEREGFVVVFPNGQGVPLHWDANIDHQPNDDLTFVDAMLDQLGADLCLDTSRVYATGLSYGAIMTSFLLCNRADRFAAAAPVAGLQMPKRCTPSRRVPILTFHGTADPILKFDGTVGDLAGVMKGNPPGAVTSSTVPPDLNGPGYPANVAAWAKANGCGDTPTDTKITESVVHRVYPCPAGADVEFDIILGGGHAWPGSEFSRSIERIVGPTTFEIDATAEAWKFFQRFALPAG